MSRLGRFATTLLTLTILCFGLATTADADPVVLHPVVDGSVRDGLEAPKDGTADNVLDNSVVQALNIEGSFEDRGIIEFRIDFEGSDLSQPITSAILHLNVFAANGPFPFNIAVYTYAGDGVLSLGDFNAGTQFTTFTYSGESTITLDVTPFINNLMTSGSNFAGFNFRITDPSSIRQNGPFTAFNSLEFPPSASLTVSTAPVPEPATFLLLSAGLGGVSFAVRKRRKGQKESLCDLLLDDDV